MSQTHNPFLPASSEFITLCQSQVAVLTQGLGAAWSILYLTQGLVKDAQTQLSPVVAYPEGKKIWQSKEQANLTLDSLIPRSYLTPQLPSASTPEKQQNFAANLTGEVDDSGDKVTVVGQRQIVLPLIHEELVMGLLVTGREDRQWNETELHQIEKIAKTISIACHLDQSQLWYQEQLSSQIYLRERLDDLLHQLRNPLMALRTFSKLLFKRLLNSERDSKVAQSIIRESDHLQELLQQFETWMDTFDAQQRNMVSLDANPLALPQTSKALLPSREFLPCEALVVTEVLEPLINSAVAIAQEKNLEFILDIPTCLPQVQANAQALREVLGNLIENAIKYTPSGGKVIIQAGIEQKLPEAEFQGIVISDSGDGIPLQDQARIFERHYRGVQSTGDIPGTGLGLAIAKELIEKMQGKLKLINNPSSAQRGATFLVLLPVVQEQ